MPKPKHAPDELASRPIEDLIALRDEIDQIIRNKIAAEKTALLSKLEAIRQFESRKSQQSSLPKDGIGKGRRKAQPKYRNPVTGETWAGRGMQPTWLRKAIEAGHTEDEFRLSA